MQEEFDKLFNHVIRHGKVSKGSCYTIHTVQLNGYEVIAYSTRLAKHLEISKKGNLVVLVETVFDKVNSSVDLNIISDLARIC